MAFTAKDSTGAAVTFKSTADSGEQVGHVNIDALPGTAAEGASLPSALLVIAGDDGTDTHPVQVDANGYLKVVLQAGSAAAGSLTLGAGSAEIGKLAAGTASIGTVGLDAGTNNIGDVGVLSLPALPAGGNSIGSVVLGAGSAEIGKLAAGTASIGTVVLGAGSAAAGSVDVDAVAMPTAGVQLLITVATSATQVASNALKSGVTLRAASGNSASIFLGFSGSLTTANGFELEAGKELFLELSNTNLLYYISANSADKLHIIGS